MRISFAILLCSAAAAVASGRSLIHLFQLESYQFRGYIRTIKRNPKKAFSPALWLCLCHLLSLLLPFLYGNRFFPVLVGCLILAAGGAGCWLWSQKAKEKKKLVITARVKRLMVSLFVTHFLLGILLSALLPGNWLGYLTFCLFFLLEPVWFACAAGLVLPVEKGIQELYFQDAKHMLDSRKDLIKIGITGSYGKTSVKFILGTMLEEKYQTLVTPSSFNTPMGVTKVVRSSLLPSHQIFVAEMGARHVGDIRELCRLVHPSMGVLTSVGPQHLDTFHTIENVAKTKYELMEAIPEDGTCFFPDDDGICLSLYQKTTKEKWLVARESSPAKNADVWAENVEVGPFGSRFMLCTKGGKKVCETRLLGAHAIQNILLASAVCLKLGMTLEQIARGISRIQPIEHRLQLIHRGGGITIIDDAFNSNPAGAKAAVQVLRQFPGRRILITPGMVELGEKESEYNHEFGKEIVGAADLCILVGPRHTAPVRSGMIENGFAQENIFTVADLNEATALLGQIEKAGDTVLFENDLPDNYTET